MTEKKLTILKRIYWINFAIMFIGGTIETYISSSLGLFGVIGLTTVIFSTIIMLIINTSFKKKNDL